MTIRIRPFQESDIDALVEILKLNEQYDYPEVEGPEAMKRAAKCEAAVFLVAEKDAKPSGLIRGIYDGARALIHLLSVHPEHQRSSIGTELVEAIKHEFARRGASGTAVTVSEKSAEFWEEIGFQRLPVFLVLSNT
jgi:N-acetylglutamate synthase-like GNAT family acetyltransferase